MGSIRDFKPDPVAFSIFGLDIRWYAIMICTGIVLAVLIAYRRAPRHGIQSDAVLDYIIWAVPCGIIGARAYYVVFNIDQYSGILDILNTRAGGLAIHGGLIFGFLAAYFVSRHKKESFINFLDLAVPCIALAQAIGRWGNYFNQEAHGRPTDLPWGILIDGQYVHPTFLYESIWCFLLFFLLSKVDKNRKFTGQTLFLYGILYSFERFFVESLRTDSLMIGPLRQAMVFSAFCFYVCLMAYIIFRKNKRFSLRTDYLQKPETISESLDEIQGAETTSVQMQGAEMPSVEIPNAEIAKEKQESELEAKQLDSSESDELDKEI